MEIPFIPQEDCDLDGVGDACQDDLDGDGARDVIDACPHDAHCVNTDFSDVQLINLLPGSQDHPMWEVRDQGREIFQASNTDATLMLARSELYIQSTILITISRSIIYRSL